MSDIEKFIEERKARNPKAWANFDAEYRQYAIGLRLAEHRQKAGLSLSKLAILMKMQKSALSRLENHGEDVKISTIVRYVNATGRPFSINFRPARMKRGQASSKLSAAELEIA